MSTRHELDLCGLKCPLPIVRLSQMFKKVEVGDECTVISDDPAFHPDLQAWARTTGHKLLTLEKQGSRIIGVVCKTK